MAREKDNPVLGLKRFEGHDVLEATIKVTNAGDGLSESVSIEPAEYALGDHVYTVMEHVVSRVSYEPMPKDEGSRRRVHTFKTQVAAVVDAQTVASMIAETREKVRIKRQEDEEAARAAKGVITLPGTSTTERGQKPGQGDENDGYE